MNSKHLSASVLALLGPTVALHAYAEIYMSEAEAAGTLLSGQKLERREIELTPEQIAKIESLSTQKVRTPKMKAFVGPGKDVVFIDQVLGKHEFITYAVAVKADGKVAGIEIIEYRESYGQNVRKPEWRGQFVGKDVASKLKVGDDIRNLSGATLSSVHITEGVKRLLNTYGLIRERL